MRRIDRISTLRPRSARALNQANCSSAETVAPRQPAPDEERCVVHTTRNQMEANLVRDQLDIRGIVCNTAIREHRVRVGRGLATITEYDAVVWSADVDDAKQLLTRLVIRRKRRPHDGIGHEDETASG